jgi:hypothetical protein
VPEDDIVLRVGDRGFTSLLTDVVDDCELKVDIVLRDQVRPACLCALLPLIAAQRKLRDVQAEAALRTALSWPSPKYAHLPQLVDPTGEAILDDDSIAQIAGYQVRPGSE